MQVFVLAMARVGWQVFSYKDVRDDLGRAWDLERVSPALAAHLARCSATRAVGLDAMARQPQGRGSWVGRVFWVPIVDFMRKKEEGAVRRQRAFRSLRGPLAPEAALREEQGQARQVP